MTTTTNAMIQAVTFLGNAAINVPAYNPPVVVDSYWQNETGIIPFLLGGAFASKPSPDSKTTVTNDTVRAIYSIAVSNLWNQQGVFIVYCGQLYNDRGLSYSAMDIKNDITRLVFLTAGFRLN